jgi:hypothetical protein
MVSERGECDVLGDMAGMFIAESRRTGGEVQEGVYR